MVPEASERLRIEALGSVGSVGSGIKLGENFQVGGARVAGQPSLESVGENRDEQSGDASLQAGDHESSIGDSERMADDGGARIEGLNPGEDAEGGILGLDEAVVSSEENAAREGGKGGFLSLNGIRDGGKERDSHDLQLTMRVGDALGYDARAVARSVASLLTSLKSALSEVTESSLDHMQAENEAAGQVQDAAIDAATKGNRFVNACLRLNEEMKGINDVASQLEASKQRLDQFEHQSNRYLPRH